MTSKTSSGGELEQESVVLASFDSYRRAEHMLASLGRDFRLAARRGDAAAVVVRGNADGSLKLTESRVLTASGFAYVMVKLPVSWIAGFMGTLTMLKGTRGGIRAVRVHEGHVGSDEHRAHQILAEAGPAAALVLVRCGNQQTRQSVAATAADQAVHSWDGWLTEFLAALDIGSGHDWVREALRKTSRKTPRGSTSHLPR